ncbi:uncharacterized protein K452DRAFT_362819 [Aplosporella prunicola CBS 121167]|uniref:AB hydrolase-1 domain-containing protein n=1 Tax=Aplosporella prunicola CBS 121167 TaxID=1176127 RepID=A0A6A6AYG4_9PEZI|nr:uncharacterized protein K452DRAFT_362819 [Aplosporella prunicola CBS 121167]KAF2136005.1 hypothetical protein K452DRAFT_362819 [Aplosporella prunicola CBS 121167]
MSPYSKFWPKGGLPGILHHYTETLTTFEFTPSTARKPHSLVFIGGLGDGLATTSYLSDLARALNPTDWSLFSLTLTSSYQSWGLGHLDRDTDEIAQCLRYVRDYKTGRFGNGKLVLMGHSTGSQCVLHYLSQPNPHTSAPVFDKGLQHVQRPALDGAIMQAPVSDREAIHWVLQQGWLGKSPADTRKVYDRLVAMAREATAPGKDQSFDALLPVELTSQIAYPANTPLSARRFLSLVSPESPHNPGEDDMFSSDLLDESLSRTWGMVRQRGLLAAKARLMVMISGADQAVPDWVDKQGLLRRWKGIADAGKGDGEPVWDDDFSGVIPGASHALSNDDQAGPRKDLCERVLGYLYAAEQA